MHVNALRPLSFFINFIIYYIMAKKKETKTVVEKPQISKERIEEIVESVEIPTKKENPLPSTQNSWKIKDRNYYLLDGKEPLSYSIKSSNIYYFDEEKGYEREMKHTENQRTCFVDEMVGEQRLSHIIFRNGVLHVPKNKVTLQKLLSLYHPWKGRVYEEYNPVQDAVDEVAIIETEIEALNIASTLDIDLVEAVMRVELGSKVSKMTSKELKRDLLVFAKRNPMLFLELVTDENVHLRNTGIKATEMGIIVLSPDQRTFTWGSNRRKLMTVPFDEHPYSALAAWFKTDEGMEIYQNIEKRLNS